MFVFHHLVEVVGNLEVLICVCWVDSRICLCRSFVVCDSAVIDCLVSRLSI